MHLDVIDASERPGKTTHRRQRLSPQHFEPRVCSIVGRIAEPRYRCRTRPTGRASDIDRDQRLSKARDAARDHWFKRYLSRPLESTVVHAGLKLFGMLPIDMASALGGLIARAIGPHLGISHRARRNLQLVYPRMPAHQVEAIVRGMWENLGRVAAEYPHLKNIAARVELVGAEHIGGALARGKPIIYFAAHLGNWEVAPPVAARHGTPLNLLYRPPNNPWVDVLVRRYRPEGAALRFVPKGIAGLRLIVRRLAAGQHLGIIIDQKIRKGVPVPFLGREAMTTRAIAYLALKFDCAVLPVQIERVRGAYFRLTVHPPVDLSPTGNRKADVRAITERLSSIIESWIHRRPEQWLWLHRRWPD